MSAGSIFDEQPKRGSNLKTAAIAMVALVVICGSAYGLYLYSIPAGPTADDILAVEVRDTTVMLLDYQTFSGDEFRQQVLGKGRLEKYIKVIDEAFFTYPQAPDQEFLDFINKNFYDITKVDFGTEKNGEIWLGDYHAPISPEMGHFFQDKPRKYSHRAAAAVEVRFQGRDIFADAGGAQGPYK